MLLAAYCRFVRRRSAPALVLALATAVFMLHTHPTAVLALAAWGATLLWFHWRQWRRCWKLALPSAALAVLLSTPYLMTLLDGWRAGARNPQFVQPWPATLPGLWGGGQNLTWLGFFSRYRLPVDLWGGAVGDAVQTLTVVLGAVVVALLALGLWSAGGRFVRRRRRRQPATLREQLTAGAVLAILLHAAFFLVTRHWPGPHYHNAVWIGYLFFVWEGCRRAQGWRRSGLVPATLLLTFAGAGMLLVFLLATIARHGGNREFAYGATLANQLAVARALAAYDPVRTRIHVEVRHLQRFPEGLRLPTALQAPAPGTPLKTGDVYLVYADRARASTDGRLELTPRPVNPSPAAETAPETPPGRR